MSVELMGQATGPQRFVPELGCKVNTFTQSPPKVIKWHVPLDCRGDFRPNQLANFDSSKGYRVDSLGYLLCYGHTKAGERCNKRAKHRFPRCSMHGGELHPLDRVRKDEKPTATTRYKQFLDGDLTVDDLDDEELACCGFRASDGRIYKPKNVPRELSNAFQKAIYERAQEELRALTVDAAKTVGEIMKNKTNEPDIRLKAALSLIERNLGKTPTNVVVSQDKPFEVVFDDISTKRPTTIIDGEIVGERLAIDSPSEIPSGPITFDNETDSQPSGTEVSPEEISGRGKLHTRNEAILAQFVERKPFEYDLGDNRKIIESATKKRYASRALGVDLTGPNVPLIRMETALPDGGRIIRHVDPDTLKTKAPNKTQNQRRKNYTLNDF